MTTLREVVGLLAEHGIRYGPVGGELWVHPIAQHRLSGPQLALVRRFRKPLMSIGATLDIGTHVPAWCDSCGAWSVISAHQVSKDTRQGAAEGAMRVMRKWPSAGIACRMTPRCEGRMYAPEQINPNKRKASP